MLKWKINASFKGLLQAPFFDLESVPVSVECRGNLTTTYNKPVLVLPTNKQNVHTDELSKIG